MTNILMIVLKPPKDFAETVEVKIHGGIKSGKNTDAWRAIDEYRSRTNAVFAKIACNTLRNILDWRN